MLCRNHIIVQCMYTMRGVAVVIYPIMYEQNHASQLQSIQVLLSCKVDVLYNNIVQMLSIILYITQLLYVGLKLKIYIWQQKIAKSVMHIMSCHQ